MSPQSTEAVNVKYLPSIITQAEYCPVMPFECESARAPLSCDSQPRLTLTLPPRPRGHMSRVRSKPNINQRSIVINVARALCLILRYLVNLKFMWTFLGIFSPRNVKYLLFPRVHGHQGRYDAAWLGGLSWIPWCHITHQPHSLQHHPPGHTHHQ